MTYLINDLNTSEDLAKVKIEEHRVNDNPVLRIDVPEKSMTFRFIAESEKMFLTHTVEGSWDNYQDYLNGEDQLSVAILRDRDTQTFSVETSTKDARFVKEVLSYDDYDEGTKATDALPEQGYDAEWYAKDGDLAINHILKALSQNDEVRRFFRDSVPLRDADNASRYAVYIDGRLIAEFVPSLEWNSYIDWAEAQYGNRLEYHFKEG